MSQQRSRWVRVGAPFGAMVAVAVLFAVGTISQGRNQNTLDAADQDANTYYVIHLREEPPTAVIDRNRMPLLPYAVHLVSPPDASRRQLWEIGKVVGVAVAVVSLGVGGWWMWRRFGTLASATAVAIAALTVYQFKAPYFQADLLYYGLFTATFVAMLTALDRPGPLLGATVGLLAGLAYLAKAGALVLLALFLATTVATALVRIRQDRSASAALAATAGASLLLFACVLAPYAANSRATYGGYLHNVNSRYYAWYDSWDEALAGTVSHGDNLGPPDLPADQIPGPGRYLRDHTVDQVVDRIVEGADRTFEVARHSYGYFYFLVIEAVVVAVLVMLQPGQVLRWGRRHLPGLVFGASTLAAYLLIAFWWVPISDGPRFSLAVFLPLVVLLTGAIARLGRGVTVAVRGRQVGFDSVALGGILTAVIVYGTWATFSLAPTLYGGT